MKKTLFVMMVLFLGISIHTALGNSRTDDPMGVAVSPQTLLLSSDQGGEVTVHTSIKYSTVDLSTVELNGVPLLFAKTDNLGNLVAKFQEEAVEAIVAPPGAVLTLTGMTKDGVPFSGSDSVRVIE